MDIAGEGDVMFDQSWLTRGLTEDHLKAYVESRNWTAVTIAKSNDCAYYKHVDYCLKPE